MANSKAEDDDADSSRRLCLICGDTKKQLSLFVLRAPEHLNGRLQHDLAVVHSTLSISKDQEGKKNRSYTVQFKVLCISKYRILTFANIDDKPVLGELKRLQNVAEIWS